MRGILITLFLVFAGIARADGVTVAVAANMLPTAERLVEAFGGDVRLAHGSTGRLYAQIHAGAPFDIFLSADAARPALLESEGQAAARRTYALGRIVLVGLPDIVEGDLTETLVGRRIAIADAALAPYGLAAEQALAALGVDLAQSTVITGDSVGQTAGFLATGNVDAAIIAASLVPLVLAERDLAERAIDEALYDPIRQDAALLLRGAANPEAMAFWEWLFGSAALAILRADGYGVPAP